jgi:basic membrane protein A and related proteins
VTGHPGNPSAVEAELRTFLIADIRGYTTYTRDRGADATADLVTRFATIVREVVGSHEGFLLELRGDEALAVFVLARSALRAALALQARFGTELDRGVGIGMDAGEAVPVEGGYRGSALNLAARLCGQAGPGEILASEAVIHLAARVDGIGYADPRTYRLKGMDEPIRAVHVVTADKGSKKPIRYAGEGRRRDRALLAIGVAAVIVIALIAVSLAVILNRPRDKVALLQWGSSDVDTLLQAGFDQGVSEFEFVGTHRLVTDSDPESGLRSLSEAGNRLIVGFSMPQDEFNDVARAFPGTSYVMLDQLGEEPNVSYVAFDDQESSYLAGAAAALMTKSGTIGFVGGVDIDIIWRFQAGFEAGARSIDPDIAILSTYISAPPDYSGFQSQQDGQRAAEDMYENGADVVFEAAGNASFGGMEAATRLSGTLQRQLWAIGVDTDQYQNVGSLQGVVNPESWREHILTSVVKRWDRAIYSVLADYAHNDLGPGVVEVGLADGGVDISYSGGFLDNVKARLDEIRSQIVGGLVGVPCIPADKVDEAAAQGVLPLCRR